MGSVYYMSLSYYGNCLILYELPIVLIMGLIGNIMNIILFSRQSLRKNVCSMYFICLSAINLLFLITHAMPPVIAAILKIDTSQQSSHYCKIRSYLLTLCLILTRHFICLITVDRWLITSSNAFIRRQSSTKFGQRLIIMSIIFWSTFSIHAPFGFTSVARRCLPTPKTSYALFYPLYNISTSLLTIIILIVFSILTICSVRSSVRRLVCPSVAASNISITDSPPFVTALRQYHDSRTKRDAQLIRLSIAQVIVFILLYCVWAAYPLSAFIVNMFSDLVYGSDTEGTISFLGTVGIHLLYLYASSTFFLYTLASRVFRREFLDLLAGYVKRIFQSE